MDQIQGGTKPFICIFSPDPQGGSLTTPPISPLGKGGLEPWLTCPEVTGRGALAAHVCGYPTLTSPMPSRLREEVLGHRQGEEG